jgi:hypothetical protein
MCSGMRRFAKALAADSIRGRAVHEYQRRVHARCNTRAKGAAQSQARRAEQEATE